MKLSDKTQKTITIDGKRYDYNRIIKDLCKTPNEAGNYYLNASTEIARRCNCAAIQSIDGSFAIIEKLN